MSSSYTSPRQRNLKMNKLHNSASALQFNQGAPISNFQISESLPLNNNPIISNPRLNRKIEKLNANFLILSSKYKKRISVLESLKDNLFINLFDQINLYVEEIERLNEKIKEKDIQYKFQREITFSKYAKENIQNKSKITTLEKQISDLKETEIKLRSEISSYKRQIGFYKDKLKIDLHKTKPKPLRNSVSPEPHHSYAEKKLNTCSSVIKLVKDNKMELHNAMTYRELRKNTSKADLHSRKQFLALALPGSRNIKTQRDDTLKKDTLQSEGYSSSVSHTDGNGVHKDKKKKIINDIGIDIKNEYDKEIKMLVEQENEITKLIMKIQRSNSSNNVNSNGIDTTNTVNT